MADTGLVLGTVGWLICLLFVMLACKHDKLTKREAVVSPQTLKISPAKQATAKVMVFSLGSTLLHRSSCIVGIEKEKRPDFKNGRYLLIV